MTEHTSAFPIQPGDPTRVGPWAIVGRLGAGGMGIVYLGRGPAGEHVAIKLMHAAFTHDDEYRARFAREAEALGRMRSPFTAALVDADAGAPTPWLAMAYVPGPNLQRAVDTSGPLQPGEVMAVALGMAAALDAMHAAGWLHRDLKPSNVILSDDGPRLIDLGIAHVEGGTALTQTGAMIGTGIWMSPEQLAGEGETSATDMFAWAALVAKAATGHHPFGQGRPEAVMLRILNDPPNLAGLERLDSALSDAVTRCLAKEPRSRLTARQVLTALSPLSGASNPDLGRAAANPTRQARPRTRPSPEPNAARGPDAWSEAERLFLDGQMSLDSGNEPDARRAWLRAAELGHGGAAHGMGYLAGRQGASDARWEWLQHGRPHQDLFNLGLTAGAAAAGMIASTDKGNRSRAGERRMQPKPPYK